MGEQIDAPKYEYNQMMRNPFGEKRMIDSIVLRRDGTWGYNLMSGAEKSGVWFDEDAITPYVE